MNYFQKHFTYQHVMNNEYEQWINQQNKMIFTYTDLHQ